MDSSYEEEFDFTDDEIREQLELLGFKNVSTKKFQSFKDDLRKLIHTERSSDESKIFNDKLNEIKKENFIQDADEHAYYDEDADNSQYTWTNDSENSYDNYRIRDRNTKDVIKESSTKLIKRKVVRKSPSGSNTVYRSFVNSSHTTQEDDNEALQTTDNLVQSNMSYLDKNLKGLSMNNNFDEDENEDGNESDGTINNENDENFADGDFNEPEKAMPVKSFIRSASALSTKFQDPSRIRKNNVVNKYHEYAKLWSKQKAPGEKSHKDLRWSIREQMLEKEVVVKRQSALKSANTYQVPTEKKRQDLRWVIRTALANQVNVSK